MQETNYPLAGLRVIDLTDNRGEMCGRYLAELGADVVNIEQPGGAASRSRQPLVEGHSLYFASHNANKRGLVLDLASDEGRAQLLKLATVADILIESGRPGELEAKGLSPQSLSEQCPQLSVLSISDFGQTGPYRDYQATNTVQMAIAGVVARSGLKGRDPLTPPGSNLADDTASIQAAWVALLSHWQRLHTGSGGYLDFSVFEATAQILDPGLGVTGSAAAGQSAKALAPRGRPPMGKGYPIFRCADGFVRICVLNPRQWQGMCDWLGDDHEFTDPKYAKLSVRIPAMRDINKLIAELFRNQNGLDLVKEGQQRLVPIAQVSSPKQVFADEHFVARNTFVDLEIAPGLTGQLPQGYLEVDGKFCGIRSNAPALGENTTAIFDEWQTRESAAADGDAVKGDVARKPMSGIRVLDLGVIVAGAELGRLFADQGAEVIKIENHKFADGLRQALKNEPITESFVQGSRGKRSLGLNLRSDKGKELFKKLVAISDIVLSNFKPGTMEKLGFGYDVLKAINPRIVVADSSALGSSGPMSKTMGYGPLVRASTGLTGLWRYPDDEESFSDSLTIIPDHFAARVSATAVLACLIRREQTGVGGTVSLSQADAIMTALSDDFLRESLVPGSMQSRGNVNEFDAPNNIFPAGSDCGGDDEWCAICVTNDEQWQALCGVIGRDDLAADQRFANAEGRLANRELLEEALIAWTNTKMPVEITEILQAAGIPAGFMQRLVEYDENPQFIARNFIRTFNQPGLPGIVETENAPVGASHLPDPDIKPAPYLAEHTEQVAKEVLGLSDAEIAELVESGDLELMKSA